MKYIYLSMTYTRRSVELIWEKQHSVEKHTIEIDPKLTFEKFPSFTQNTEN